MPVQATLFRNRLLAALPEGEADWLRPRLTALSPALKERLFEAERPVDAAYFIESGVVSMVTVMDNGDLAEVATVGSEGMVGLQLFLGSETSPLETFMQIPGEVLRMEAEGFLEAVERLPGLRRLLQRYTQALFVQIARNAACNGMHRVEQRAARWLLLTHDRVHHERFLLTHEFLSQMLGVRRASVTEVMRKLKEQGLIYYERGTVTVVDRKGLEAASCGCYRLIADEHARVGR